MMQEVFSRFFLFRRFSGGRYSLRPKKADSAVYFAAGAAQSEKTHKTAPGRPLPAGAPNDMENSRKAKKWQEQTASATAHRLPVSRSPCSPIRRSREHGSAVSGIRFDAAAAANNRETLYRTIYSVVACFSHQFNLCEKGSLSCKKSKESTAFSKACTQ